MKNLKKLTRNQLKNVSGAKIAPGGGDELVKCGTTWCNPNYACCYHKAGFYYCDQAGYCTSN
ncbi:bacteriocin-like protein [Chryseobacterium sp. VD8]|uniref:bacteriocin-like protein n=1 Tax=Chryseobacterium sp. VD8 TaxID=3081254 RepID=UPI0030187CC5